MSKTYNGTPLIFFLADEADKIRKIFDKVNVSEHAAEVSETFGE